MTLKRLWFLFSLEVKQLLQTKAELEKELESMKEGERERREREKALRLAGEDQEATWCQPVPTSLPAPHRGPPPPWAQSGSRKAPA